LCAHGWSAEGKEGEGFIARVAKRVKNPEK